MFYFKPSPLLKRVFAFSLCFFLAFFFAARPIVASANVADTSQSFVNIATNYTDVMQVAPVLVPIILILIALEWYYSNIDQIAAKANELYFEGSAAFQAWAENCAQQMINGSSTFVVSSVAAAEINSKLGNYVIPLETGSVLVLPADLLSLRTLNPSDVLITSVTGVLEDLEGVSVENNKLLKDIKAYLSTAFNNLITWQRTLNNTLTQRLASIRQELYVINSNLSNRLASIRQELYVINGNLSDRLADIRSMQTAINQNLSDRLSDMRKMMTTINTNLADRLSDMQTRLRTLNTKITELPSSIAEALGSHFSKIQTSLDVISTKLDELLKTGTDVTTKPNIEVVAGTQTIVVSDYATMGQAFSAKMGWIPQIFDFLAELRSRLNSGTAPNVAIDLSDAEGSYNYGGRVYVLDMSWYARYKPSVDTFLSGVMWICFGWAIYKRIPDILSGVGLTVENATETRGHVWADRAEREASLSYRQERRSDYYAKKNNKGG